MPIFSLQVCKSYPNIVPIINFSPALVYICTVKKAEGGFEMSILKTKCGYASKCGAYRDNSITCTKESDKHFCGIYKQFEQKTIEIYTIYERLPTLYQKN
jgi:hypothetical protein